MPAQAGSATQSGVVVVFHRTVEAASATQNETHQGQKNRYVTQLEAPSLSTRNCRNGSESLSVTISLVMRMVAKSSTTNVIKAVMVFMLSCASGVNRSGFQT